MSDCSILSRAHECCAKHFNGRNPPAATVSELRVVGMTCNNCARKVTDAIQSLPGVQSVMVNAERAVLRCGGAPMPRLTSKKLIGSRDGGGL